MVIFVEIDILDLFLLVDYMFKLCIVSIPCSLVRFGVGRPRIAIVAYFLGGAWFFEPLHIFELLVLSS